MLRFATWWLGCAAACAPAQTITPPGFGADTAFSENTQAASVRGFAYAHEQGWLVAIGPRLVQHFAGQVRVVHEMPPGDDIAFCRIGPSDRVWFGSLRDGHVFGLAPAAGEIERFAGVANAFAAAPLPSGQVLLSANPLWPQPNAQTGIWLTGPGLAPRELLTLTGPSGPLVLDPSGNLIIAELGSATPPPPGGVRLLRIPATRLQQAIAGATLTTADADLIGPGWNGAYDLLFDPLGRLTVTDGGNVVRHALPATLTPAATPFFSAGAGRSTLQMQTVQRPGASYAPYQPTEQAPALLVATSNFTSEYGVRWLAPQRPRLTIANAGPHPPGPVTLTVSEAPPQGFCWLGATLAAPIAERAVSTLLGSPLWLALPDPAQLSVVAWPLDPGGYGAGIFNHPGGFAADITLQALALGQSGVGTTQHVILQVHP